jgi:hypothetical protein
VLHRLDVRVGTIELVEDVAKSIWRLFCIDGRLGSVQGLRSDYVRR